MNRSTLLPILTEVDLMAFLIEECPEFYSRYCCEDIRSVIILRSRDNEEDDYTLYFDDRSCVMVHREWCGVSGLVRYRVQISPECIHTVIHTHDKQWRA